MIRVGIDIDGTLGCSIDSFINYLDKRFNLKIRKCELSDFNKKPLGFTKTFLELLWDFTDNDPNVFLESKVFDDASDVIKKLKNNYYEVVIASYRLNKYKGVTKKWLKNKNIIYDEIYIGESLKQDLDLNILIDDTVGVIKDFLTNSTGICLGIVNDVNVLEMREFNHERLYKVKTWKEIESYLL